MAKIILISCSSKKLNHNAKARNLYISPLFKKSLDYAKSCNPDKIFILSAKYGLVGLDEDIDPYNKTLNRMHSGEIENWADLVIKTLKESTDLDNDQFIFLAGLNYRRFLIKNIAHYEIPMKGLGIGKQLKWLSENTRK